MSQPTDHGAVYIAAHKYMPELGARHSHYEPVCHSISLTGLAATHDVYVVGTPADLHNWALAVLAVADQAAAVEAKLMAGPLLNGKPVEPATNDEFVGL
jgi:hypothetical protein